VRRLIFILVFVLCPINAWAQTIYVPSGDHNSIQSAIVNANHGDVIIVAAGTYYENINFLGKAVTVRSTNPNDPNVVAATIINGSHYVDLNLGSVVTFNHGEAASSILSGFTITGGTGSWLLISWEYKGLRWNRCGGGVVCYNMSAPTISRNVFINNIAGQGGGLYIYGNPVNPNDPTNPPIHITPVITDNTFINNTAIMEHGFSPPNTNYPLLDHGDGGAIVCFQGCDATITGNLVRNNHAEYYGGGIHLRQWSNGLIEDNHIIGNDSMLGGGIHVTYDSSPLIRLNTVEQNTAGTFGGGGIYVYAGSNPLIELNLVTANSSPCGAGIAVYDESAPLIRNNLIVKNKDGAGIRVRTGSTPQIIHNTIADNTADSYSGAIDCTLEAAPIFENNIITASNGGYSIYADESSSPVLRYNNTWSNGPVSYGGGGIADQAGLNGNISAVPNFVDADSNDYHIRYDSKCINAGNPNFSGQGLTDYAGLPRKTGQFTDIGAYEAPLVWNISSGINYNAIQQAINSANNGDTIVVTPSRYFEKIGFGAKNLVLRSVEPNDWSIVEKTIIDANHTGSAVVIAQHQNSSCVFTGFTVTGGSSTNGHGGGVYCYASPRIERNIIENNYSYYKGGGVYFWSSDAKALLNDNIIRYNTCSYGAGVFADTSSVPVITNNIIMHNDASGSGGGGIVCSYCSPNVLVANNIISENIADEGAGVYCVQTSPVIVNNLIYGNAAAIRGGAFMIKANASPQIINNTIADNKAPRGAGFLCWIFANPNIINNIIAFSKDGEGIYCEIDVSRPSVPNLAFNNIYGNSGGNYGGSLADQTGLNGNISIDPNFVRDGVWNDANTPAEPNDDFLVPGNYHLSPTGSACIDAGDNLSVPAVSVYDIDGEQRIFNGIVDIGADEFATNPVDLNNDGIVDCFELGILKDEWLQSGGQLQSDFNDDDFVDFVDFAILASQWLWTAGWHE